MYLYHIHIIMAILYIKLLYGSNHSVYIDICTILRVMNSYYNTICINLLLLMSNNNIFKKCLD